jgi:hypothetical protein
VTARRFWFPKMTINRLLTVWLLTGLPLTAVVALVLHWPGPALLVNAITWAALRMLNRAAWKRHFAPRRSR